MKKNLKKVPTGKKGKGLKKLPKSVRNKICYEKRWQSKKQGYKAREDESLGMRTGKESSKKQSMKARRDESYGKWGKRPNQKINK